MMEEYFPGILREICVALPLIGFVRCLWSKVSMDARKCTI